MGSGDQILVWSAPSALTVTNLASLAAGDLWVGGVQTAAGQVWLRLWYEIVFAATPSNGDGLRWWIGGGDGGTPEILEGNLGTAEAAVTTAGPIAEIVAALSQPAKRHVWQTSHTATFRGRFDYPLVPNRWVPVCQPYGATALAASGHTVRYQLGTPQLQP